MRHILIALFALSLIACNLLSPASDAARSTNDNEESIPGEPTPLPPTSAPSSGAFSGQEIRDERAGFAFNVPADWYVNPFGNNADALSYSATVQSIEPGIGGGGFPEGETKVDVYVDSPETGQWSLNNIETDLYTGSYASGNEVTAERIILDTGVEALRVTGTDTRGSNYTNIFTVINGYRVAFSVIGEVAYLEQIANSMRPLN